MSNENQGDIVIPVLNNDGVGTGVSIRMAGETYVVEEHGHCMMEIYSDEVDGFIRALQEFKVKAAEGEVK